MEKRDASDGLTWVPKTPEELTEQKPPPDRGAFFRKIYDEHWDKLRRRIARKYGYGPPDPEDVAQMAFCRLLDLDDPYGIGNVYGFLVKTADNLMIDLKKHDEVQVRNNAALAADAKNIWVRLF